MKNRLVVTAALTFLAVLTGLTVGAGEDSEARAAWERLLSERQRDNPAFAFVEDDPALPRVLLIGDSISIGYTADVRALLAGEAQCSPDTNQRRRHKSWRREHRCVAGRWEVGRHPF